MIKSFRHKGLKKFFLNSDISGINPVHANKLKLILTILDAAEATQSPFYVITGRVEEIMTVRSTKIEDVNFPGSRLHPYTNNNLWSVDVSGNYRILFEIRGQDIYVVDYKDPH